VKCHIRFIPQRPNFQLSDREPKRPGQTKTRNQKKTQKQKNNFGSRTELPNTESDKSKLMKITKIEITPLGDSLINKFMLEGYEPDNEEPVWREFAKDENEVAEIIRLAQLGIHAW
jgi:hypothetical protein